MEASACNSRNEWRTDSLVSPCYGRADSVEDIWVNRSPAIVPCYNGKSLQIHEELVVNGLSAISIKHHQGNCSEAGSVTKSEATRTGSNDEAGVNGKEQKANRMVETTDAEKNKQYSSTALPTCLNERMKRRNSFWNMHRPELSKLTWPQDFVSPAMLRDFFHHHLRTHGTFCEPLHLETNGPLVPEDESPDLTLLRELVPPMVLPPDEKALNIMEKSRSVQLNDEDLDPEIMVHKSRAEFCVTVGEYLRKPLLRRSASQQMPKGAISPPGKYEMRDGVTHKEEGNPEELVSSAATDSSAFYQMPIEEI